MEQPQHGSDTVLLILVHAMTHLEQERHLPEDSTRVQATATSAIQTELPVWWQEIHTIIAPLLQMQQEQGWVRY